MVGAPSMLPLVSNCRAGRVLRPVQECPQGETRSGRPGKPRQKKFAGWSPGEEGAPESAEHRSAHACEDRAGARKDPPRGSKEVMSRAQGGCEKCGLILTARPEKLKKRQSIKWVLPL